MREIQAEGYAGGTTILRAYLQPERKLRPSKATVRFETEPGQQLQSDWGEVVVEIAGQRTKVSLGKDERMVGYGKGNFFVRYHNFDSWVHLNQLAEQWLRVESDQRVHGTVKEVVVRRFHREQPTLKPLPRMRYDTSYFELR